MHGIQPANLLLMGVSVHNKIIHNLFAHAALIIANIMFTHGAHHNSSQACTVWNIELRAETKFEKGASDKNVFMVIILSTTTCM